MLEHNAPDGWAKGARSPRSAARSNLRVTTTELPISPQVFCGLTALLAFGCLCWAIVAIQPRAEALDVAPRARMKRDLGLQRLPDRLFVVLFALWGGLLLLLTAGVLV